MKNQSGAIKTNLELYRVVQVVTGDSQEKVMIFRDKQTLHHNIYIIIVIITILIIIIHHQMQMMQLIDLMTSVSAPTTKEGKTSVSFPRFSNS